MFAGSALLNNNFSRAGSCFRKKNIAYVRKPTKTKAETAGMNTAALTKKKALITLAIIVTLAATTINGPKFGLYSVDLETKTRKSSESAEVYKQIIG